MTHPIATPRTLLTLAWPVIVSRSTQVVVGLADALMIAHLGESALAATTTGGLNAFAGFIFPMGIAFVIASFSAQLTGRDDAVGARRFGWYGFALALVAQAVTLALLPGLPWLLSAFDYTPEVEGLMNGYLGIRLLSTGAAVGIEALANYYGGCGNTSLPMKINVTAMLLNVAFNWLLIDGHLGFPALGVAGAAWASVTATSLAFALFAVIFILDGRGLPRARLTLHEFMRLLRFGVPAGLNWSFEFFAFIAFVNIVVAGLGTVSLAAMMAVMQINSVSFMPAFGLGSAGAILVGQSIGAGDRDSVPGILRMTFLITAAWMGIVGLAYMGAPDLLLQPFAPAGEAGPVFLVVGVQMLFLSAFWQLFDAAGITLSEALRAAGDTTFTMWARGVLAWGVFLPGSWITVRYFDGAERSTVLWLLLYLGVLAGVLYWRFRGGAWRRIELIEEPAW
ncbi:MAG: MATE family efflux transporter [Gammaproteobacteria bacterium]